MSRIFTHSRERPADHIGLPPEPVGRAADAVYLAQVDFPDEPELGVSLRMRADDLDGFPLCPDHEGMKEKVANQPKGEAQEVKESRKEAVAEICGRIGAARERHMEVLRPVWRDPQSREHLYDPDVHACIDATQKALDDLRRLSHPDEVKR